jgi:hypothetical protein
LEEIVELNQNGAPDEIIIRALAGSRAVYKLNTADVQRLRQAGVSDAIIDFTLASRVRYAGAAYRYPRYHYGYYDYPRYGSFRYRSYPYRYYHRRHCD